MKMLSMKTTAITKNCEEEEEEHLGQEQEKLEEEDDGADEAGKDEERRNRIIDEYSQQSECMKSDRKRKRKSEGVRSTKRRKGRK